jgi:hypothetical protein
MELVDGMALRGLCGFPVPVDRVLNLGDQISKALSAAQGESFLAISNQRP